MILAIGIFRWPMRLIFLSGLVFDDDNGIFVKKISSNSLKIVIYYVLYPERASWEWRFKVEDNESKFEIYRDGETRGYNRWIIKDHLRLPYVT